MSQTCNKTQITHTCRSQDESKYIKILQWKCNCAKIVLENLKCSFEAEINKD